MQLSQVCGAILNQLEDVVMQLSDEDFCKPSAALGNVTIGQHLRHTLEFFMCLQASFDKGVVNYDNRAHDKLIENDKCVALSAIQKIRDFIANQNSDQSLKLHVGYDHDSENYITIETNYFRELTYNIEHAIHHMAIMKIGVREVASYIKLHSDFGVAVSTIRHRETVAVR